MMISSRGLIEHLDFSEKEIIYNPHITAITRAEISRPLRYMLKESLIKTGNKVLDYGAGKLKDTNWLNENGCECTAYDKYHPDKEFNSLWCCFGVEYDILMCNYVFNVIKELEDFKSALKIIKNVKAKHKYISIRNDVKSVKPNWEYCNKNDCYYTGRSYQRFIGVEQLDDYFGLNRIIKKTSEYILIELLEDEEWKNR
ncbi:MAG: methyltransferase domain-containing protein [Fusobacteriaceae bacterium]